MTVANVQILLKRGNTTASSAYIGPLGELTMDTTLKGIRIHDGVRAGGNLIVQNQLTNGANVVSLGADGMLTFPGGSNIGQNGGVSGEIDIVAGSASGAVSLISYDGKNSIWVENAGAFMYTNLTNQWYFGLDGTTTFPGLITTTGNIITTGNLITAGGRIDSGYQYYSPSGNLSFTANTNVSRVILDPSSAISLYANITLPGGNVDAKIISISSTANVQFLSVMPSLGCTLAPFGNITLSAGTKAEYFFHAVESKWYKVG